MKRVLAVCGIAALAAAMSGCACGGAKRCYGKTETVRVTQAPVYQTTTDCYTDPDLVGPRGPDGPAGPAGERGATGLTGAPGYAVAGPRGGPGAIGNPGEQGPTGATGPDGLIVRGRAGVQGPAGQVGAQGATGLTGAQGESAAGFAGQSGPQGPMGPAGATGIAGARGPTMEGPAGPAGFAGPAGAQGVTGHAGAQGSTTPGVAGPMGLAGARGPQGPTGEIGAQGGVGDVSCWTSYREFWFQTGSADIPESEKYKLDDIATYMKKNPSLNLGLDGSVGSGGTEGRNQNLSDRRTKTIRDGLIAAGVPSHKISVGAYGDTTLQRDRRVEVLFASAK